MLYNPPSGATGPNDPYVGKNVAAGIQGSRVPPAAIEVPQRELVNLILAAGQSPTNADLKQILRAVRKMGGSFTLASGTPSSVVVTLDPAPIGGFAEISGAPLRVVMPWASTGAALINFNSLGAVNLVRADGAPLKVNDFIAGQVVTLVYDGTNCLLQGVTTSLSPPTGTYQQSTPGTYTWVCPAWVYRIRDVECWGGGGAAATSPNTSNSYGGSGGGGGYAAGEYDVIPGNSYTIIVGAGGTPPTGSNTNTAGGAGGLTSMAPQGGTAFIYATGGGGGTNNGAGAGGGVGGGGTRINLQGGGGAGGGTGVSPPAAGGSPRGGTGGLTGSPGTTPGGASAGAYYTSGAYPGSNGSFFFRY